MLTQQTSMYWGVGDSNFTIVIQNTSNNIMRAKNSLVDSFRFLLKFSQMTGIFPFKTTFDVATKFEIIKPLPIVRAIGS